MTDITYRNASDEPLYTAVQIKIPPELPDILKNYTKHIIRTQPGDILASSAEYFGRLARQKTSAGGKRLNNMQLESFYNKFYATDKANIARKDVDEAASKANIPASQITEAISIGAWPNEQIPWMKLWALLCAAASGTLVATVETVCEILGDNGQVPVAPVSEVLSFLATVDQTVNPGQVNVVVGTLSTHRTYSIDALLEMLRTQVRPLSAAAQPVRSRPVKEAAPAAPTAVSPPPEERTEQGTAYVDHGQGETKEADTENAGQGAGGGEEGREEEPAAEGGDAS
ncbi:Ropporin-1-like protein [Rhizophlyctis rosea]|uniref:Ropporin-1-like protein n=1 Tax=Rhizophlyctis rosea TaxID=64517 RepID=A0AAD5SE28_9FUNG|nr:Ropporin-1-like protein [Rhizophlyctis rosea]